MFSGKVISGMGAYDISNSVAVRTNSLFGTGARDLPKFSSGPRYVEIYHREFVKDVIGGAGVPSAFLNESFAINPGLKPTPGSPQTNGLFPWLSTIASQFETYQFMGLALEFVSTTGQMNSVTGGLGSVVQVVEYNALNPAFTTKEQMMNYDASISSKPSVNALCGVECSPNDLPSTHLYVRDQPPAAGSDERLYDLGNYQIATQGLPVADMPCGELWVTYHVRLYQPKLSVSEWSAGIWAYNEITSVLNSGSNTYTCNNVATVAQNMINSLSNYWNAGSQQSSAQNPVALSVVCNPEGFNLPDGGPHSDNYIWKVLGATVAVGRTIELSIVWNCGNQNGASNVGNFCYSPALSDNVYPQSCIKESNTMNLVYPLYQSGQADQMYPYGWCTRWVITIPQVWMDEATNLPYIPIILHSATSGAQSYNGSGNWTAELSCSVIMYDFDEESGPLSVPYVGPAVVDSP